MTRPPVKVWNPGRDAADSIDLARSIAIVRMRRHGVSWRAIGVFLGTPEATIRRHYDQIPPATRADYIRTPLDILGLG